MQVSVCPKKKMVSVGWQAIQTLLLSLVETLVEKESLHSNLEWTKHMIIHRGQTRTIWRMLQHLKVLLPKGVNDVVGNLQMGIFIQKCNTLCWHSLVSCFSIWSLPILEHLTVTVTVYFYAPLLILFQKWYLWVPEECQHHFLLIATFWTSWFVPGHVVYTMLQSPCPAIFPVTFVIISTPPFHPFCLRFF